MFKKIRGSLVAKISIIGVLILLFSMAVGIVSSYIAHDQLSNTYNKSRTELEVTKASEVIEESLLSIENLVNEIKTVTEDLFTKDDLANHAQTIKDNGTMERIRSIFEATATKTEFVCAYWMIINPQYTNATVSDATGDGFFRIKRTGMTAFTDHDVINVLQYTEEQRENVGWWYDIKNSPDSQVWIEPYYNANIDQNMFTYTTGIVNGDDFLGAIGVDVDLNLIVNKVKSLTSYSTGYNFLLKEDGTFIYHKDFPTFQNDGSTYGKYVGCQKKITDYIPKVKYMTYTTFIYKYKGVDKYVSTAPLRNHMSFCFTVSSSELDNDLLLLSLLPSLIFSGTTVLLAVTLFLFIRHSLKPVKQLTKALDQIENGDFNVKITPKTTDEIGRLSKSFNDMVSALKTERIAINALAFQDGLTGVKNKNAQEEKVLELNKEIKEGNANFAVLMLDVNDLKNINDSYGHIKGDQVIRGACLALCHVFKHSPVYRIGGDEFLAIIEGEDYENREALFNQLKENNYTDESHNFSFSVGLATYQRGIDGTFASVYARADEAMYKMKRTDISNKN